MTGSFVYIIRPVGMASPVKIGLSDQPEARLLSLTTWSPVPLELVATIPGDAELERNIHDCFADLHSHREWFTVDERLAVFVAKIVAGVPVEQAVDLSDKRGDMRAARYASRRGPRRQKAAA